MDKQPQPYVIAMNQDQYIVSTQPGVLAGPAGQAIIISQPTATNYAAVERDWSTGICGCFEDCGSCALTFFFPYCYLCCCLSRKMGETCGTPIIVPDTISVYRMKLRAKYNIRGSAIGDCCCSYYCSQCVICQMAREIKHIESKIGGPAFPMSSGCC